jgi:crotonobetainyl-CoA:carnitine CoA-transferase CaiB-like acyl-CoA transferase
MTTAPLSPYLVVDLTGGIAGAYCTKLLADGGATVVKVESPDGDPLRRWSASGAEIPAGADGALFAYLSSTKQSLVVDLDRSPDLDRVRELLQRADAVLWSRENRLTQHRSLGVEAIRTTAPHLTVTAITPFGLDGPWSERASTEFTLQAWAGGIVGLGRGSQDRAPVFVGGQIGEWLTGVYAAIGTLTSLRRAGGHAAGGHANGELVDVSMLETMSLCLTYYPVTYADMAGRPFRTGRSVLTPGVESTSDGLVGVGVGTGQQWLDFCVMVDHAEWTEDRSLFVNRAHLQPEIAAWMAKRTTAEVLELAALLRIPHAPIGNGATIPSTDHFVARGSIVANPRDGFDEPGRPYRFTPPLLAAPQPAPTLGQHDEMNWPERPLQPAAGTDSAGLPFAGVRVLDLTAFWAGPVCTHVLAMLGAEVLHVESTARPDGTRLLAGMSSKVPDWWERSGVFAGLNTNKQSVTIDLSADTGRDLLRRLIATCDVIVENYTPRVLEQLGLDFASVASIRPDVVMVRMPGFGLDGPWRDDPAFAFVIEDASGLTWLTGYPDENPLSPYCVGDSNAGLHAAFALMLALQHRQRSGDGVLVEASMVDAALSMAAEQLVEFSAYGALLTRDGNRGPTAAPQNLYLTADVDAHGARDAWVAIAVATDDQWLALREAMGSPAWAMDPALLHPAARRRRHDEIDTHLTEWCALRSSDDIVDTLWSMGVPTAKVMQPHEQPLLEQLAHRRFFEDVEREKTGTARHSTLPMRFSSHPQRWHRTAAPLLGEHTDVVLRSLGVTETELAALSDQNIIGRVPDAARR